MDKHVKINGNIIEITEEDKKLLRATASHDRVEAAKFQRVLAQVVQGAWRSGILEPDLLDGIYDQFMLPQGSDAKFPLDHLGIGAEGDYKAFLMPKEGGIPTQAVDGDELYVTTYKVANSIDWSIDYARDARWDIVARAIEVFTNGFVQRLNDDGWHVILHSATQNALNQDTTATAGVFTLSLLTLLQTAIKRLTSGRNSKVTDLYFSPEGLADIRNLAAFEVTSTSEVIIDQTTLRSLVFGPEDTAPTLFGVRLHEMQEFGEGQEYETYVSGTLATAHTDSKVEFCVALDLNERDSFVMPIRENMSMFEDDSLHRSARMGVYGWMEVGFAAIDTRRAILGQF